MKQVLRLKSINGPTDKLTSMGILNYLHGFVHSEPYVGLSLPE